jgi:hypothetical protein
MRIDPPQKVVAHPCFPSEEYWRRALDYRMRRRYDSVIPSWGDVTLLVYFSGEPK